jgi:NAD(P)H-hydrate epimerase
MIVQDQDGGGATTELTTQGGDGLVAARHLHHFRYKPTIYLPKPGNKDIYQRLLKQCENLKIPIVKETNQFQDGLKENDAILDAIFGE